MATRSIAADTAPIPLRYLLYRQLEPTAWTRRGLSPLNMLLTIVIVIAVIVSILETEPMIATGHEEFFDNFEFTAGCVFLVEYIFRLWVQIENPKFATSRLPRLRYALTPIAMIDLLAVLPAIFAFGTTSSLVFRFFRVLGMLRLAKLGRTSRAWEYIRDAVYDRRYEFGLILGLLVIAILISGSLLYWAEADAQPDKFGSIPRALWWAVITLTTVGYGDTYPITTAGKILSAVMAIIDVMLIALPTGLFAASFTEGLARHRKSSDPDDSAELQQRLNGILSRDEHREYVDGTLLEKLDATRAALDEISHMLARQDAPISNSEAGFDTSRSSDDLLE